MKYFPLAESYKRNSLHVYKNVIYNLNVLHFEFDAPNFVQKENTPISCLSP